MSATIARDAREAPDVKRLDKSVASFSAYSEWAHSFALASLRSRGIGRNLTSLRHRGVEGHVSLFEQQRDTLRSNLCSMNRRRPSCAPELERTARRPGGDGVRLHERQLTAVRNRRTIKKITFSGVATEAHHGADVRT